MFPSLCMQLTRKARCREMQVATSPKEAWMLQRRARQQEVDPSDASFGENGAHHVAVRDLAKRMTGEKGQCRRRSLFRDPHGSWLDNAVTRDFVLVRLVLDREGDDVTTLQFVDVHERCIGRCAMPAKNNVSLFAGCWCAGPLSDAFVEDRISNPHVNGCFQFQFGNDDGANWI
ncbi:MAG: hypothetical protein RLY19_271 [Actinomycetota bacterium]